jgi:protein-disulfide isomerase
MTRLIRGALIALCFAAPAAVCAQQNPPAPAGEVAARIGDRVITVRELDEQWKKADPVEHTRATQMLYDGRRQALERIIADLLIEQAAKAKGVSAEQYAKEESAKRLKPVTDAEVDAFYKANQARMQGKPVEEMRQPIREFLTQQQQGQARQSLVNDLKKGGPAIRVMIDPPRQTVEVAASDPTRGGANAPVTLVEFSDYQ